MITQAPVVYAYKGWFGQWKFKFLANGLPRADKPVTLLYHRPANYDILAISADAWQKVARESVEQNKELHIRIAALTAELMFTKNELEQFYEEDLQHLAAVPATVFHTLRGDRGASISASAAECEALPHQSDTINEATS